jgi:hypothetical protein
MVLIGSDLSQEEADTIRRFAREVLKDAPVAHFGTPGVASAAADADEDKILKRTSKTANLHGLEKLGIKAFSGSVSGVDGVLVFRGGRAQLPDLKGVPVVGVGVFNTESDPVRGFSAVLPGHTFLEKSGTFVNCDGREQRFQAALIPPRGTKAISEILMMWVHA